MQKLILTLCFGIITAAASSYGEVDSLTPEEVASLNKMWQTKLGLSDKQLQAMKVVMHAQYETKKALLNKRIELRKKLRAQLEAKETETKLLVTLSEMQAVDEQLNEERKKAIRYFDEHLLPSQRAKIYLGLAGGLLQGATN